ncbi:MAG TPA: glycogen debranching N-terminal domain-containing protein [Jatrophihabitans sp.]
MTEPGAATLWKGFEMPHERFQQPWLHKLVSTLRAPTVVLSGADGQIRARGAEGILHSDIRVLSKAVVRIEGAEPESIAGGLLSANSACFSSIARTLGDDLPDPTVRIDRFRTVEAGMVCEQLQVDSRATGPVSTELRVDISADLAPVQQIKAGRPTTAVPLTATQDESGVTVRWSNDDVRVELSASGAQLGGALQDSPTALSLCWPLSLDPGERLNVEWSLSAVAEHAPVIGRAGTHWDEVSVRSDDRRLAPLVHQSLIDLGSLLMALRNRPDDEFLAAGSPWYFTLFGRDSIWAARLMLPFGTELAAGTLRTLAALQGSKVDVDSAEQPGKIPHELRHASAVHEGVHGTGTTIQLPPLYYGTIDATPLWICLLHDAWKWGMPNEQVRDLLPALQAALGWLRDYADADRDGFLEYLDSSGHGLTNQGWKDSGDSVRFLDGRIAEGPVALCEVQGYGYEAAMHGADLLDEFGLPGADGWRAWAANLAARFREAFWVEHPLGRYPALALDGAKRQVDSLTSNIGHLLATGILNAEEADAVAQRLGDQRLSSGFGLRTMSTDAGGFSPLSYHCGSVWPHDTAIAIHGLAASGHAEQAVELIEGLLAASVVFDFRLPELFSGDDRGHLPWPAPYPASCRPQAWSAAAVAAIVTALLGIEVDVPAGEFTLTPVAYSSIGAVTVVGLRAGSEAFTVEVDADGTARADVAGLRLGSAL